MSRSRWTLLTAACVPALALMAALALAACGDGETTTVTETETTTTQADTSTSSTTEDGSPPPADIEVRKLTLFSSPTGNIGCAMGKRTVRCDVGERNWEPPDVPAACDLDYGQGIQLIAGGTAEFVCAGDTTLGGELVVEYGESIASGLLRCESSEAGMRCLDIETGRGFTVSRQAYEIF